VTHLGKKNQVSAVGTSKPDAAGAALQRSLDGVILRPDGDRTQRGY
jgi:hypothetical protein